MEKFYIVSEASNIYKAQKEHEAFIKKICEVFNGFAETYGIETSQFYPSVERLEIAPTDRDREKFGQYFVKSKSHPEGTFKLLCPMAKDWADRCKKAGLTKSVLKPTMFLGSTFGVLKYRARLFEEGGALYCTMESDTPFNAPEGFEEIKASDFYKRMEDLGVEI